jgi:hypothetical protein
LSDRIQVSYQYTIQIEGRKLYEQKKQTCLEVLVDRIEAVYTPLNVISSKGGEAGKGAVSDDVSG